MNCFFRIIFVVSMLLGSSYFTYSQVLHVEISNNKVVVAGKTFALHTVKQKQTLFSISRTYGVDISKILKINHKSDTTVALGEVLRIPIENSEPTTPEKKKKEIRKEKKAKRKERRKEVKQTSRKPKEMKYIYHTVRKGDTMYSLQKRYNVSESEIKNANPEIEQTLSLGAVIMIPNGKVKAQKRKEFKTSSKFLKNVKEAPKDEKKYYYYLVKEGDTESSIIEKFFMQLGMFERLNPELTGKPLQIGAEVKIPRHLVSFEREDPRDVQELENLGDNTFSSQLSVDSLIKQNIRVALFLPLYLEINDTINQLVSYEDTLKIVTEREPRVLYAKSKNYIRFYQGVLLAVDSLKNQGIHVDLQVYDTERDVKKVRKLLNEVRYQDFDFFVGPVYQNTFSEVAKLAEEKNIPIISPLSPKNKELRSNPYIIQINTSIKSICDQITDYVTNDFEYKNIVIVHPDKYQYYTESKLVKDIEHVLFENGKYWQNDEVTYKKISFDKYGLYGIEHVLCDSMENVIILPVSNQPIIENIITNINVLSKRYAIRLIGFSKWQRFTSIDADIFYNLNLSIFSPYHIDYKLERVDKFVKKYRKQYLCEPTDFSFSGYDILSYFSKAVGLYGKGFMDRLKDFNPEQLQSAYQFKRFNTFGGLENRGGHLINYSRDYKIRHRIVREKEEEVKVDFLEKSFEEK